MPRPHPVEVVATVQKITRTLAKLQPKRGVVTVPAPAPTGRITLGPLLTGQTDNFLRDIYAQWCGEELELAQLCECLFAATQVITQAGPDFRHTSELFKQLADEPLGRWYATRLRNDHDQKDFVEGEEYTAFKFEAVDAVLLNQLCEAVKREARFSPEHVRPDHSVAATGKSEDEEDEDIMLGVIAEHPDRENAKSTPLVKASGIHHQRAYAALARLCERGLYRGYQRARGWRRRKRDE